MAACRADVPDVPSGVWCLALAALAPAMNRLRYYCPAGHSGISPCSGKTALRVAMIARATGSDGS
jgi:hypothetical protein